MATTYNHVQIGVVNKNGDVDVLYPQNTAKDVAVNRSSNTMIPSGISNLQGLVDKMGDMAFEHRENMVFLGASEEFTGDIVTSEINDDIVSKRTTWSSKKIQDTINSFEYCGGDITDIDRNIESLTGTHKSPRQIIVDGDLLESGQAPVVDPDISYTWIVEYFPTFINSETNEVEEAYQRWTGINRTTNMVNKYDRVYANSQWLTFNAIEIRIVNDETKK